jgi:lipoprotein-releasing system permease protein
VQASLFNALNMEKFLTTFMLLMIVVIGAVNIISTLVMVVSDKSADIAILRTMGASRQTYNANFHSAGTSGRNDWHRNWRRAWDRARE